jgi:uncharacterized protein (TIGR03545 family)
MKRSYLWPRLALAALVLAGTLWRLDRLARQTLIETGEAFLGSAVDVGEVDTSLAGLTLTLRDVAAAHPNASDKNLVECDEAIFHLDAKAALQRRFVVREGRISGLKFNTPRAESGLSIEIESDRLPLASPPQAELGGLEQFAELSGPLPGAALTATPMAREIAKRWPQAWASLETAADGLAQRVANLNREMEVARRYPLKASEKWQLIEAESDRASQELEGVQMQLAKLREQATADQAALTAAWKADQQKLQAGAHVGQFDPDQLTTLLLGAENTARVHKTLACVRWLRQQALAPASLSATQTGKRVLVPGALRGPDFLIESIAIAGEAEFAGQLVTWEGTASGLTTDPKTYGRPAVLRLLAGEPCPMTLEGVFDHTGEISKDRIAIDSPLTALGERTLGDAQRFALTAAPAAAQIRVVVELTGDQMHGEIVCKQERTQLSIAHLADSLANSKELLQSAAGTIQRIESRVELAGTLTHPTWKLRSDLGLHLANSFRDVLQRQADGSREAALQAARQELAIEVEKLDGWLAEKQEQIGEAIASARTTVEEMQVQVAERQSRSSGGEQTFRR